MKAHAARTTAGWWLSVLVRMKGVPTPVLLVVEVRGWVSVPELTMPASLGGECPRNCEAPPIIVQYSRDAPVSSVGRFLL